MNLSNPKKNMSYYDGDFYPIRYFKEIGKISLLSSEEEKELAIEIAKGSKDALNKLVEANLRLVAVVAKDFVGKGLSYQDLIQEGNIGLIEAAKRFNPTKGRFTTYAIYRIKRELGYALAYRGKIVKRPVYFYNLERKLQKYQRLYMQKYGVQPTIEQIAVDLEMDVDYLIRMMSFMNDIVSFEKVISPNGDLTVGDIIKDTKVDSDFVENDVMNLDLREKLDELLECLSEKEKKVIFYRYLSNNDISNVDIAKMLGVTRSRVSQLSNSALDKLKNNEKVKYLRLYISDDNSSTKKL